MKYFLLDNKQPTNNQSITFKFSSAKLQNQMETWQKEVEVYTDEVEPFWGRCN